MKLTFRLLMYRSFSLTLKKISCTSQANAQKVIPYKFPERIKWKNTQIEHSMDLATYSESNSQSLILT